MPVSGSYHTADAAGLLWSLHPAFTTGPGTAFVTSPAGFTVRLDVLTGGQVRATATIKRLLPVTTSTQTVRQDGFAATFLYGHPGQRPRARQEPALDGRGPSPASCGSPANGLSRIRRTVAPGPPTSS